MDAELVQAGERLRLHAEPVWVADLLEEAAAGQWRAPSTQRPDVVVVVEGRRTPFDVRGWEPLTRGAFRRGDACVLVDACSSGFDILVETEPGADGDPRTVQITARWRPPVREHLAALVLRARFRLLVRALLVQYPALWRAGLRGRVPLHASAVDIHGGVPLLVGPGGVGRTSLLEAAARSGGRPCSDNLVSADCWQVYGLVEPMRTESGHGRRMSHGRREEPLPGRVRDLAPDRIVVLRRGTGATAGVVRLEPVCAARVLTAATYMAGELRRYWPLAATLAMATGLGPPHPPVSQTAHDLAARLPATELTLAAAPGEDVTGFLTAEPAPDVAA
ncbi:MAG: hypothetical protein ACXVXC_08230 [Nocardioidaceae bacterium]